MVQHVTGWVEKCLSMMETSTARTAQGTLAATGERRKSDH